MGTRKLILALVIFLSTLQVGLSLLSFYQFGHDIFWDLDVYKTAVKNFENNSNPYSTKNELLFIYHPIVLDLFGILNKINLIIGLGVFYSLSLLFMWLSLGKKYSREILLSVSFGGIGLLSFASGNVTPFLHLFLFVLLLNKVRTDKFFLSYAVIFIFSLIKPYFLAYYLVPIFVDQKNLRQKTELGLFFLAIYVATVILYQAVNPDIVSQYHAALRYQIVGKEDVGFSFFYWFLKLTHSNLISIILHSILSIALIVLFYFFRVRWSMKDLSKENTLYLTYFILTIINPRMKEYDLFPALLSIFIFGKNVLGEKFLTCYVAPLTVVSFPLFILIVGVLGNLNLPELEYLIFNYLWLSGGILVFFATLLFNAKSIKLKSENLRASSR